MLIKHSFHIAVWKFIIAHVAELTQGENKCLTEPSLPVHIFEIMLSVCWNDPLVNVFQKLLFLDFYISAQKRVTSTMFPQRYSSLSSKWLFLISTLWNAARISISYILNKDNCLTMLPLRFKVCDRNEMSSPTMSWSRTFLYWAR